MCGIVGIVGATPSQDRRWLSIGRDAMTHRGPDDAGEWWSPDGCVGLAHRRLAIVDLSAGGHQPMHDASGNLTLVFNGEIYNFRDLKAELIAKGHRFYSSSDTEVILASYREWGYSCLDHFNGMFALALYDAQRKVMFLARDRAGEKPLFFYQAGRALRFASELKALLADRELPRRISAGALDCFLAMGYVPGEACILQGFNKLKPAHALLFDLTTGRSKTWRYWQPADAPLADQAVDEPALLDELEILMEGAVRAQLVSDVPVGILLSGGVDSSIVTAMAARLTGDVQTFTVGFPGHRLMDESEQALLIARYFGTRHTQLEAQVSTLDFLPQLARQFDEPIADSSMIPTFLVSEMVSQHCTVALGGDGGDELFGGYPHYSRLLRVQEIQRRIPYCLSQGIALLAEKFLPTGYKGRNWAMSFGTELDKGLPLIASLFDVTMRQRLLRGANGPLAAEIVYRERTPGDPDLLQRATRMDFANYLAEDILVKVDRASMLSSVEMRAPMLDSRLINFAFGKVPSRLKATSSEKKILLKRLASRILPDEFDSKRKQGFSIPLSAWLKEGGHENIFVEVLRDPQCIFDADTVDELIRGQRIGRNNGERLFALVIFELWRREYEATF